MALVVREEELVELARDGQAAGAPDEFAAGGWGVGLAGLGLDLVDALDQEE